MSPEKTLYSLSFVLFSFLVSYGQSGSIHGNLTVNGVVQEFATIAISTEPITGTQSDKNGNFNMHNIPYGTYNITTSYVGLESSVKTISIGENNEEFELQFDLIETIFSFDDVVITGTKTFKRLRFK